MPTAKIKYVRVFILGILALCIGFGAFHTWRWWQTEQKRKQLFVYIREKSPVTKRLPVDSVVFASLYDFKRAYGDLRGTRFYKVLAHFLDTGASGKQPANPVLGGMLESTILKVVGEELGLAFAPASGGKFDLIAISKLAPGSDFLLNLALASSRNARRIDRSGETIYEFETKDPAYPLIYVFIHGNFAYVSTSVNRIQKASSQEGSGPQFLARSSIHGIPEDTVLFVASQSPEFTGALHGTGSIYTLQVSSDISIASHLPRMDSIGEAVLQLETNALEIIKQPAFSFLLESIDGQPATTAILTFADEGDARNYQKWSVSKLHPSDQPQPLQVQNMDCYRYVRNSEAFFTCNRASSVWLSNSEIALNGTAPAAKNARKQQSPLILNVHFDREKISPYFSMAGNEDWSRFGIAKEFYFLSCIRQITGGIDENSDTLTIELL